MYGPGTEPESPDELLALWLSENDAEVAQKAIELLLAWAQNKIRTVVRFNLGRDAHCRHSGISADVDDICQAALGKLFEKLDMLKKSGSEPAIEHVENYTAAIAFNACNAYFRKKYPNRYKLEHQIRYIVTKQQNLRLWSTSNGIEVCGDAGFEGQDAVALPLSLPERLSVPVHSESLIDLVLDILHLSNGPVRFDALVNEVANLFGIKSPWLQFPEGSDDYIWADSLPGIEDVLRDREYLGRVWAGILRLSLTHRRCLLLNLKDSGGADIVVFALSGVATMGEIAQALAIRCQEFEVIWRELPWDDRRIAKLCGVSIQKVINRRSAARQSLARYLRDIGYEKS